MRLFISLTQYTTFAAAPLALSLALPLPAWADPLPTKWQAKREAVSALTERACKNDPTAMGKVRRGLDQGDPVMMNAAGWLQANCMAYKSMSQIAVVSYQERSAAAGYPIGQHNYAERLIKGNLGVKQDVARGLKLHETALLGGFGESALRLAQHYSSGTYVARDIEKARRMLGYAELEKVPAERIAHFRAVVDQGAQIASGKTHGSQAQQAPKPTSEEAPGPKPKPKPESLAQADPSDDGIYMALAVSLEDGIHGFADEIPGWKAARNKALDECWALNGADCDVKLIVRGKGCIAYHWSNASPKARGWAASRLLREANSRAARDCGRRNAGATCENVAEVCNETTRDPLIPLKKSRMP